MRYRGIPNRMHNEQRRTVHIDIVRRVKWESLD